MSCDDNGPKTATHCTPCSPAVRNRYFRGKLLTVADYEAEQQNLIHRRRLISRTVLGWGIVSGFRVRLDDDQLVVGRGVAIDAEGRELVACERVTIAEDDDVLWLKRGKCGLEPMKAPKQPAQMKPDPASGEPHQGEGRVDDGGGEEGCVGESDDHGRGEPGVPERVYYLLSAHYAERQIDGVRVSEGCDSDVCENNHICETVVYSLRERDGRRAPPYRVLECLGLDAPKYGATPKPIDYGPHVKRPATDGVQPGLCRHDPEHWRDRHYSPCDVRDLVRNGDLHVDFDAGVPLAYVKFRRGKCNALEFDIVAPIIHGCEPTRIKDVGWHNWHVRPNIVTGLAPFADMFRPWKQEDQPRQRGGTDYDREREETDEDRFPPIDTRFWVCFSAPVQIRSLFADVMTMTLVQPDKREAVGEVVRVPICGLWYLPTQSDDPPGTTRGFRPFVRYQFWEGEIEEGSATAFKNGETVVEIRIDGDAIVDWTGRPVDGNAVGRRLPSGNGTPGGEFLSSWRVKRRCDQMPGYPPIEEDRKAEKPAPDQPKVEPSAAGPAQAK